MASHRIQKAAEAVREVVSMAILTDLKDPRIQDVTVTHVEMSPDMRQAKVHVSVMGNETKQRLSLAGLKSAAGFLQSKVAKRIDTRYTPRLVFVLDMGVKKSIQIAEILHRVLPPAAENEPPENEPAGDEVAQDRAPPDRVAEDRVARDQEARAAIDADVTDGDPFREEE
ncbi:MAG TPA: 30S ribosome-binding factor RbfA [Pirellulales bacterium]|jgi:ribosome-binding factor A|nr:30S ribosome-binding factor RbfA [Pirellulales bacterium]